MERCEISVVMSVYNGEKFLKSALDSIVSQTFRSFELVVINDASTDSTPEILRRYAEKDERIKVFTNEKNLRLARSLNKGISLARGKYIVRADADDIFLKNRLEKQFEYMRSHPDSDISFCKYFTLRDGVVSPCAVGRKCDAEDIKAMFLFFCPVLHPGVIAKADLLKKYEYDPLHTCSEDLDLWTRMICDGAKVTCCDEYLLLYRLHGAQITATTGEKQKTEVLESEQRFYSALLAPMSEEQSAFYIESVYFRNSFDGKKLYEFYRFIVRANRRTKNFRKEAVVCAMSEVLAEYRRTKPLSFCDKLSFVRFGGFRLAYEILSRKKQGRADLKKAREAAELSGLEQKGVNGLLPIYGTGEING